jgi:hypothetical protein
MALPSPEQVAHDLEAIAELTGRISAAYGTVFSLGYEKRQAGDSEPVSHSGISDPTGAVATGDSYRRIRARTGTAARLVRDALAALDGALSTLGKETGGGRFDQAEHVSSPFHEGNSSQLISRDELREAHEARIRRDEASAQRHGACNLCKLLTPRRKGGK